MCCINWCEQAKLLAPIVGRGDAETISDQGNFGDVCSTTRRPTRHFACSGVEEGDELTALTLSGDAVAACAEEWMIDLLAVGYLGVEVTREFLQGLRGLPDIEEFDEGLRTSRHQEVAWGLTRLPGDAVDGPSKFVLNAEHT